jgi:hypothetical protein
MNLKGKFVFIMVVREGVVLFLVSIVSLLLLVFGPWLCATNSQDYMFIENFNCYQLLISGD